MARTKLSDTVKTEEEKAAPEMEAVKTEPKKELEATSSDKTGVVSTRKTKRVCSFCANKKEPAFTDSATLRKYMSDRFRIVPRAKSGVCSKHQRRVTVEIKRARHLSLLPFVPQI